MTVNHVFSSGELTIEWTEWPTQSNMRIHVVFHLEKNILKERSYSISRWQYREWHAVNLKFIHTEGSKSNIPCCALLPLQVRATFAAWYVGYASCPARNICVTYMYTPADSRCIHAGWASHPRIRRKCCVHLPREEQMLLLDPSASIRCKLFHNKLCLLMHCTQPIGSFSFPLRFIQYDWIQIAYQTHYSHVSTKYLSCLPITHNQMRWWRKWLCTYPWKRTQAEPLRNPA
jgi:hypothetical protein